MIFFVFFAFLPAFVIGYGEYDTPEDRVYKSVLLSSDHINRSAILKSKCGDRVRFLVKQEEGKRSCADIAKWMCNETHILLKSAAPENNEMCLTYANKACLDNNSYLIKHRCKYISEYISNYVEEEVRPKVIKNS